MSASEAMLTIPEIYSTLTEALNVCMKVNK
jgi:hypothetical protein